MYSEVHLKIYVKFVYRAKHSETTTTNTQCTPSKNKNKTKCVCVWILTIIRNLFLIF